MNKLNYMNSDKQDNTEVTTYIYIKKRR